LDITRKLNQEGKSMASVEPLAPGKLYHPVDPAQLQFETTEELRDLFEIIGQPRAVEAVQFGMGIEKEGFNIFAHGPTGTGKRSLVRQFFEERAKKEPVPDDWCYVHNFEHDSRPNAIRLPAGKGSVFKTDMDQLVEELRTTISAAFESDEYRARRQVAEEETSQRQEKALEEMQQLASQQNLTLIRTPGGLVFAPVREGEVMPPEDFQKLSPEERDRLEKTVGELQEQLQKVLQMVPVWQREVRQRVRELNREITNFAVGNLMAELRQKYVDFEEIVSYLDAVQKDVVENSSNFLPQEEPSPDGAGNPLAALMGRPRPEEPPTRRYKVNILVDHQDHQGAPVIYEDNPTYQNLIGRVEHMAQMGALVTDFTLIKPGALHLANGGYLILDVRKVLQQPYTWEALKRALLSRQITIESIGQMLSLITTVSLEPEPIPLDVKVALIGDRWLYYLLSQMEPDFRELFKVQADFEEIMPRTAENQGLYARVIGTLIHQEQLRPFDRGAVARVIEHSSRLVGDAEKLSIQLQEISDLLSEADYWASQNGNQAVSASDVQKAIDARVYRSDRLRERFQESILRETVLIDTLGSQVGQVNGLSVIQLGDYTFGTPSRITARVRMGKGDVVNIEREVNMSGPIHSKGVLILSSFLGARYAIDQPLSLSASLVFEQSYSGVEGDSASSAELYALLSAISEIPIRQSLAVTGSVDQHGRVQAIGGVNEKIEGFFDICNSRGLTGEQGVLIPASNVKNLMLRQDVVEAVAQGKFRIYPVTLIDQGIELLTGIPAGEPDEDGKYPEGTVNGKVQARLVELAQKRTELDKQAGEDENKPRNGETVQEEE
jgi:lon-related putative ATP-dependent protease